MSGILLWMPFFGPLPKPTWFGKGARAARAVAGGRGAELRRRIEGGS